MIRLSVIGHLGQDALKKVVNGKSILSFSVARNEQIKNSSGGVQYRTTWINCTVWERDGLAPYLTKGKHVFIEGRPTFSVYSSLQGETLTRIDMRVSELEFLPDRKAPVAQQEKEVAGEERSEEEEDIEDVEGERRNDLPF